MCTGSVFICPAQANLFSRSCLVYLRIFFLFEIFTTRFNVSAIFGRNNVVGVKNYGFFSIQRKLMTKRTYITFPCLFDIDSYLALQIS
jgi:hypothetical protein